MNKILVLLFTTVLLFASCDKIENPVVPNPEFSANCDTVYMFTGPVQTQRNVLLEKYTGHKCNNCPWPGYLADSLEEYYFPDQLIIVSIHPDHPLNEPSPAGAGSYETDLRTEEGIDIYGTFVPVSTGVPAGVINRIGAPSNYVINKFLWHATIDTMADDTPLISLQSVLQWHAPSRTVCVNTEAEFLADMNGTYRVLHYLIEDSIVDWQKNGSPVAFQGDPNYAIGDIPNYVHNHVLRDVFGHLGVNEGEPAGTGNVWGDQVASGSILTGDKFYARRSLEGISNEWDEDHLSVITFIYNVATNEVLQVLHTHLEP